MTTALPVNTKQKRRCAHPDCPEAAYFDDGLCHTHHEDVMQRKLQQQHPAKGQVFIVAQVFAMWEAWEDKPRHPVPPQMWLGKYKVFGIKPIGSLFALILGKHDAPVIVQSDQLLSTVKQLVEVKVG